MVERSGKNDGIHSEFNACMHKDHCTALHAELVKLRLQYAGAIGLMQEASVQVDEDTRESMEAAMSDWCDYSGWTMKRILNRIELYPPRERATEGPES